ncbi:hypothetical protein DFJ74DRAFT_702391 [Hyaloraphidium curvatum]|nr:hypothetical protein DFJ74DRAFT_702391 [Hyaloraphidium curvatum]
MPRSRSRSRSPHRDRRRSRERSPDRRAGDRRDADRGHADTRDRSRDRGERDRDWGREHSKRDDRGWDEGRRDADRGRRERSRSASPKRDRRRSRSRSASTGSSSSDSSGSGSRSRSSSGDRRRKDRHRRERDDRDKKRDSKDREKEERRRRKKEKKAKRKAKEEKKARKEKEKKDRGGPLPFGARGILRSTDMYTKDAEFHAWLTEIKRIDPGVVPPRELREYFAEYAEDFNTCTLPHEKYYDLARWEKASGLGQDAGWGGRASAPGEVNLFEDEEALRARRRNQKSSVPEAQMSREQLQELKRVYEERIIADRMAKQGLEVNRDKMGVRYEERLLD